MRVSDKQRPLKTSSAEGGTSRSENLKKYKLLAALIKRKQKLGRIDNSFGVLMTLT